MPLTVGPGDLLRRVGLGRSPVYELCQDPLVAASYPSQHWQGCPAATHPDALYLGHARRSPLRWRLEEVRRRRCPRPSPAGMLDEGCQLLA